MINKTINTSVGLSKKLKKAGCLIKSNIFWTPSKYVVGAKGKYVLFDSYFSVDSKKDIEKYQKLDSMFAYDILNDLCVKHTIDIFCSSCSQSIYKKGECSCDAFWSSDYLFHGQNVLFSLLNGDKKHAEKYLWKHCNFNPKNKNDK